MVDDEMAQELVRSIQSMTGDYLALSARVETIRELCEHAGIFTQHDFQTRLATVVARGNAGGGLASFMDQLRRDSDPG